MQSFQKLATLIALMLFASKEAAALPQPYAASSDSVARVGAAGHQIGVASRNINLGSVNARDELDLEARRAVFARTSAEDASPSLTGNTGPDQTGNTGSDQTGNTGPG